MPVRSRRVISLLLMVCGIALILRPAAALSSSSPVVLINEFMAGPNSTSMEWVELFNPNTVAVDISGWKIDDDTINTTHISVPAGTILPSNSLLVFPRSGNLFNITDTVQLLDNGNFVIDRYDYTNAPPNQSFARIPDGGTSWQQGGTAQYIPLHTQGMWNSGVEPTPAPTY